MLNKKKIFALILCLCLILPALISCNSSNSQPTSNIIPSGSSIAGTTVSVQLIEYTKGSYSTSLEAKYYVKYNTEQVSNEEISKNQDKIVTKYFVEGKIYPNKDVQAHAIDSYDTASATLEELEASIGKTFYYYRNNTPYKITYKELVLAYINITFLSDSLIEVSYYKNANKDVQRLILNSESYMITFFTND